MQRGKPKNSDLIKLDDIPPIIYELTGVNRCRATIYNWAKKGRHAYDGTMLKLTTSKRLGRLYTTRAWVEIFIRKVG